MAIELGFMCNKNKTKLSPLAENNYIWF